LFDSLEDAAKAGGFFPIQSQFTATDPQTKYKIKISSDGNFLESAQSRKPGESVTQNASEYNFRHAESDTVINLIDTPGLLDTTTSDVGKSTHDRDKEHIDNILKLLSAYQEIHAIFIVMKASEARFSAAFQYTLTETFKRLDKSACNNVIFILTNAGSSNFKTDETQPIIQRFLNDTKLPIALPPTKPTIYCFENDTVKYLAECKNNIPHNEEDEDDAQRSWRRSVKTTRELLDYLFSLKPHSLAVMMSIHEANVMVYMMSKLLLDTMMCIFKDMDEIEQKKNEAERLKKEITRNPGQNTQLAIRTIKTVVYMPAQTKLYHKPLGRTNVVCESSRCAVVTEEGDIGYPQICCSACKASRFFMVFCSSMTWLGDCKICGCAKNEHRWSTTKTTVVKKPAYQTEIVDSSDGMKQINKGTDSRVNDQTVDSNKALKQINEGISQFENRVRECSDETEQMIDICAKLNAFAQQNALLWTSDDELLKCLENQQQTYARWPNTSRQTNALARIKSQYERHLRQAKGGSYKVDDVPKLIQQLCDLPMKGDEIKQAVDEYEKERLMAIEESKKSKKHYVVKRLSDKFAGLF